MAHPERAQSRAWKRAVVAAALLTTGGMLLAAAPLSDSVDFFLDTTLTAFQASSDDSADFDLDTWLQAFQSSSAEGPSFFVNTMTQSSQADYAGSGAFALNTTLTRRNVVFAASPAMPLDTREINRSWGDSEGFGYNNPLGCVGSYVGSYAGASAGTLQAYFDCNNAISFTFISYFGSVDFQSVASVAPNGTIAGTFQGVTLAGTFNFTQCTASGTWSYSVYGGTWSMARSAPGPCLAPKLTVSPKSRDLPAGTGAAAFSVSNTGGGNLPWSAGVLPGTSWLRIVLGTGGMNGGLILVVYDANPDPGPRTGVIRVSAPGATPPTVDIQVTQAGTAPPPTVTHFEFDPLPGPYMVNEPIPVTIRAIDGSNPLAGENVQSSFSGCAQLEPSSDAVQLSKSSVCFQNGIWSGAISIDQPFNVLKLQVFRGGVLGQSGSFDVNGLTPPRGCVSGFVTGPLGLVDSISGATVELTNSAGIILTQTTPASCSGAAFWGGEYCFCGLPPGPYRLTATKGVLRSLERTVDLPASGGVSWTLLLDDTSKPPVLLVPGLPGSTESDGFFTFYPYIGSPESMLTESALSLVDPGGSVWGTLKATLQERFRVIPVPWNWREGISDAIVQKYLLPKIQEARKRSDGTQWPKVRVVAHSMGGLLVRQYIQSDIFGSRKDIESLAMCGTPHQGAALAYYIWDGAAPWQADDITNSWFPPAFYSRVLARTYYAMKHNRAPNCIDAICGLQLQPVELRNFIHDSCPGLGQLMPTYKFLLRQGTPWPYSKSNRFLEDLVGSPNSSRMIGKSRPSDAAQDSVRTMLFRSYGEPTLYAIPVVGGGIDGVWSNGVPADIQSYLKKPGDGTVAGFKLEDVGLGGIDDRSSHNAKHVFLMKSYADEICEFLNDNVRCSALNNRESEPTSFLSVGVTGRVQARLIGPDSLVNGIDPVSGEIVIESPGASVDVLAGRANLAIRNPTDGEYTILLSSLPQEVFSVEVMYFDEIKNEAASIMGILHQDEMALVIDLRQNGAPALALQGSVEPPTTIRSANMAGNTRIEWDASPDPNAVEYHIYGKPDDQPKYALLGTTTGTSLDTGHPFSVAGSAPIWQYFVVAATADGTESLFDTVVENRHPLVARFDGDVNSGLEPLMVQFSDASAGDVTALAWDFDSDGTIDSTEQNPTHTYDTAGSYTVTLTVGGPEGTDTTVQPGFIHVEPINPPEPPVPGDFDGDRFVGLADFAALVDRVTGPFEDPQLAGWHVFDFDFDYDVDLRDIAVWQNAFEEP